MSRELFCAYSESIDGIVIDTDTDHFRNHDSQYFEDGIHTFKDIKDLHEQYTKIHAELKVDHVPLQVMKENLSGTGLNLRRLFGMTYSLVRPVVTRRNLHLGQRVLETLRTYVNATANTINRQQILLLDVQPNNIRVDGFLPLCGAVKWGDDTRVASDDYFSLEPYMWTNQWVPIPGHHPLRPENYPLIRTRIKECFTPMSADIVYENHLIRFRGRYQMHAISLRQMINGEGHLPYATHDVYRILLRMCESVGRYNFIVRGNIPDYVRDWFARFENRVDFLTAYERMLLHETELRQLARSRCETFIKFRCGHPKNRSAGPYLQVMLDTVDELV